MSRWDARAPWYSAVRRLPPFSWILHAELRNLSHLLREVPVDPPRVLEIGIGTGDASAVLPGRRLIGCDLSHAMVCRARKRYAGLLGLVADALALPVRTGSFSLVAAIGLTEYLKHPETLLAECKRVLSPGGYLLITRTPPGPLTTLRRLWGMPLYPVGEDSWRRMLWEGGWEAIGEKRSLLQVQYLLFPSTSRRTVQPGLDGEDAKP